MIKIQGNVCFTQSINDTEDVEYHSINANVPENKDVTKVDNQEVILEDTQEVKEIKERLKMLNEEISEIKLELLENMKG